MDNNDWRLFNGSRGGVHKSGLVIHASSTFEEDEYLLKYYNLDHFKGNDDDKVNISKEFIEVMNERYKDNAHYIIPAKTNKQMFMIGRNNIEKEL